MNTYNHYQMKSLENNGQIMCTKCELKGHNAEACHINLKRQKIRKSQTVYITETYMKCTKCNLVGHGAERCYINLRKHRAFNTEKINN